MFNKFFPLVFIIFFLASACGDPAGRNSSASQNAIIQPENIVLLLDLSDRIKVADQIGRDTQLIFKALDAFTERQQKFSFQISKDKLSVHIPFQEGDQNTLFEMASTLSIDMEEDGMNAPKYRAKYKAFKNGIVQLYQTAVNNPTSGADIWSFFRNQRSELVHIDLRLHSDQAAIPYANKAIVLTDGYLQFDRVIAEKRPAQTFMASSDLEKLRKAGHDWKTVFEAEKLNLMPHEAFQTGQLETYFFELNPKNSAENTEETQFLRHYWADWFAKMQVNFDCYERTPQTVATYAFIAKTINPS